MSAEALTASLDGEGPPDGLAPPLAALWWLKKGGLAPGPEWERAHAICQAREGDRAHDLAHGLAHWIGGDLGNADHWYRRTGERREGADVAAEWDRLAGLLADAAGR